MHRMIVPNPLGKSFAVGWRVFNPNDEDDIKFLRKFLNRKWLLTLISDTPNPREVENGRNDMIKVEFFDI